MNWTDSIRVYNSDCLEAMKGFEDNQFDLAIVDPPYGIGFGKYERYGYKGKEHLTGRYKSDKQWDQGTPSDEYFKQLLRVSKQQIVWGGNYFPYLAKKPTPNLKTKEQFNQYIEESDQNWIFWYKQNPVPNFADGELAWVSFDYNAQFDYRYYGNLEGNTSASDKIHPTQKPKQLYNWLLDNYASKGDCILDTHGGSLNVAVCCNNRGFDLTAYEVDSDYYEASYKRFKLITSQTTIW